MILITAFSIYFSLLQFGYEITEARASTFIATILGNLTLAFANSAEVGTSFFDTRRFVFWSILAALIVVVTILLTVDEAGALFQITAPPVPLLVLTILGSLAAGGWFGFAKILASYCPARRGNPIRRVTLESLHKRSSNASWLVEIFD